MEVWLKDHERIIVMSSATFTVFSIPLFIFGALGATAKIAGAEYTLACWLFCTVMAAVGFVLPPMLLKQTAVDRWVQIHRIIDSM